MENRYACVTGADRSLGLELVRILAERGFVVFAGKYLTRWNLLENLKAEYPERIQILEIDVSSDESVSNAAKLIAAKTNSLDILINNAAVMGSHIHGHTIFEPLDFDKMLQVYNVNALGALRMTNALFDLITASFHKLIVNISSEAGSIGTCWRYNGFDYCMSKAALNMSSAIIHNSLYRENKGQVMNLHPGGMRNWNGPGNYPDAPMNPSVQMPAFTTVRKSAEGIINMIFEQERFKSDHPAFITYGGDVIPW